MFEQNKYTKWYFNLIQNAKDRKHGDEIHHIIPRCLGGNEQKDNLVSLSYREHYIAHALLTKMHNSVKLKSAFWQMSFKNKRKYFNGRLYCLARDGYVKSISGDVHWSKSALFRTAVSENWTTQRKNKFKEKVSGKNHWTKKVDMCDHAANMRKHIDLKAVGERSRALLTENNPMKNPEISSKFKKPKDVVTCPHCKKSGGKPVMVRYHFDNCKFK
jgi:hypothetical protein